MPRRAAQRSPLCGQVVLCPVTAPRFSCSRRSRSISTSRSSFFRHDSSRRSRSSAATITLSWMARPRAVSVIEWVRPSSGAVRIVSRPRFCSADEVAAHRALVEADHLADPRGRNARLDRQLRDDPPLGDVDAEILLVEGGGAVRQLVADEGDERRHIAVEVEQRAVRGICGIGRSRPAGLSGRGWLLISQIIAAKPLGSK